MLEYGDDRIEFIQLCLESWNCAIDDVKRLETKSRMERDEVPFITKVEVELA